MNGGAVFEKGGLASIILASTEAEASTLKFTLRTAFPSLLQTSHSLLQRVIANNPSSTTKSRPPHHDSMRLL